MVIKVLGSGCKNCQAMEQEVINVLAELNVAADVQKVEEMEEIMKYDVMITPALVINDNVKVAGRMPKKEELKKMITEELT